MSQVGEQIMQALLTGDEVALATGDSLAQRKTPDKVPAES
jgi:hypothetical protein